MHGHRQSASHRHDRFGHSCPPATPMPTTWERHKAAQGSRPSSLGHALNGSQASSWAGMVPLAGAPNKQLLPMVAQAFSSSLAEIVAF